MKPAPLSEDQIEEVLKKVRLDIRDDFFIHRHTLEYELEINIENEDGTEETTFLSSMPDDVIKEFMGELEKKLKIFDFGDLVLYKKLKLVTFYDEKNDTWDFYKLHDCNISASSFEIIDANGKHVSYTKKYNINKRQKRIGKLPFKPPETKLGKDARTRLNK
nr:hypothetical protein [uncultured Methanolobus sp.]